MLRPNAMITDDGVKFAPPSKITQNNNVEMNNKLSNESDKKDEISYRLEATLHALIGVLIRYESEMCVSDDTFSLRHLNEEQTTNVS